MDIEKYKEELKEYYKESIKKVISGEAEGIEFKTWLAPDTVRDICEELGLTYKDEFDCNGWIWDFWDQYEYNGESYTLAGTGYYGSMAFSKNESI